MIFETRCAHELVNPDVRVGEFQRDVLKLILRHVGSACPAFSLPGAARACQVEEERPRRFETMLGAQKPGPLSGGRERAAVKSTPNARDRSGSATREEIEGSQPA